MGITLLLASLYMGIGEFGQLANEMPVDTLLEENKMVLLGEIWA
jgi:hypothetical protein